MKHLAGMISVGIASLLLQGPSTAADMAADWSCSCLTYDGSTDNCYMLASISGSRLSFSAFETSAEGSFKVSYNATETVVTGDLRTSVSNEQMTVVIAQPADGSPALIYTGQRTPGGETFTAHCEGKLPHG